MQQFKVLQRPLRVW